MHRTNWVDGKMEMRWSSKSIVYKVTALTRAWFGDDPKVEVNEEKRSCISANLEWITAEETLFEFLSLFESKAHWKNVFGARRKRSMASDFSVNALVLFAYCGKTVARRRMVGSTTCSFLRLPSILALIEFNNTAKYAVGVSGVFFSFWNQVWNQSKLVFFYIWRKMKKKKADVFQGFQSRFMKTTKIDWY